MTDLNAPITDVTVYADRALITRRGNIQLEAGEHTLQVNNLPQFLRESLRAAGKGPQGSRILNVDITTAFYSRPPEAEIQALQNELEALEQQQHLLLARQESLKDRRHWLRALGEQSKDFAKGLAQGQMKPPDCADFFSFMAAQSLQDAEAAQNLEGEIKRLQEEIEAKRREIYQKQGTALPDRLAAVVTIALTEAGNFELELSYLIMNASWQPQYDVRVQMNEEHNQGEVELTYIGIVKQFTGEPWENVTLALSTARPSLVAIPPEIKPWYLKTPPAYPPPPVMAAAPMGLSMAQSAPSRGGGHMMFSKGDLDGVALSDIVEREELPAEEAAIETAEVERTGTALVFRIGRSVDIPSDNSPHKTTIARDSLPCAFDYVSAPVIEENVHLRATITNTTERVLLKGDTSIFLSGEYVGTTQVKMTAPRETFKIFLGIDDSIKVKREVIERAVEKGNILQNDVRRTTYSYRITVHNYASFPRQMVLRDHLPVSEHERLKVKVQALQPQPTKRTKLEVVTWKFSLPADAEQVIEYRFIVEHPQNLQVIGLPSA